MQCFVCRSCMQSKETKMFSRLSSQQSTVASNWNLPLISSFLSPTQLLNSSKWILLERYVCIDVSMYSHVIPWPINFPWFHQFPVLETPDGPVFESNAIARYGTSSCNSMYHFSIIFLIQFKSASFLSCSCSAQWWQRIVPVYSHW